MTGRIQVYIRKNDLPENQFADFNTWDIGDILGISGSLFKTKSEINNIYDFLAIKNLIN